MAGAREKVELFRLSLESLWGIITRCHNCQIFSSPELNKLDGVELFLQTVEPKRQTSLSTARTIKLNWFNRSPTFRFGCASSLIP